MDLDLICPDISDQNLDLTRIQLGCRHQCLCSCGPCMFSEPLEGYLTGGGNVHIETATIAQARVKSVTLEAMMFLFGIFRFGVYPERFLLPQVSILGLYCLTLFCKNLCVSRQTGAV